jgi:hypothetical protein
MPSVASPDLGPHLTKLIDVETLDQAAFIEHAPYDGGGRLLSIKRKSTGISRHMAQRLSSELKCVTLNLSS